MQPKDFIPKTPENNKRLQKKFEKMTKELQRQKTMLDDDVPVLLFESPGSLVYSPTATLRNHHRGMEKRLQEMKEKRENLSPTLSQVMEQTLQSPDRAVCKASVNNSCESLSSGGDEGLKAGGSSVETASEACPSSPAPKVDGVSESAAANPLSLSSLQEAAIHLQKQDVSWRRDALSEIAAPEAGVSEEKAAGKHSLSLVESASGDPWAHSESKCSSARRKRTAADLSLSRGRPKKRCNRMPTQRLQLFKSEHRPQSLSSPTLGTLDSGMSSYEDYFSPDNLKERNSENLPPEAWSPSNPSVLCCRGLSKQERTTILEMSDFSCMSKKPRSVSITDSTPKSIPSLEKPASGKGSTAFGLRPLEGASAAKESQGHCMQPAPRLREDPGREGSNRSGVLCSPDHAQGASKEAKESVDVKSIPKEGTALPVSVSSEGEAHSHNLSAEDCDVEKPADERESASTGHSESVNNGPARPGVPDSRCTGLVRPQEETKKSRKAQKPTRTLVMTSMPSEKQNLVIQVVNTLQGFSLAPKVCKSTTHVLVGNSLRTLNVLLGIARGCWVLSYEWVLWSLEMGHWISEEPFELSSTFPAAPVCRLERQLSAQRYQGTLFANQPKMFISAASQPPRAKLCELVLLCGGRVSPGPQQASLIIGPYSGKKEARIKYLSEKWVLDSITQHKVCDLENYLLLQ